MQQSAPRFRASAHGLSLMLSACAVVGIAAPLPWLTSTRLAAPRGSVQLNLASQAGRKYRTPRLGHWRAIPLLDHAIVRLKLRVNGDSWVFILWCEWECGEADFPQERSCLKKGEGPAFSSHHSTLLGWTDCPLGEVGFLEG